MVATPSITSHLLIKDKHLKIVYASPSYLDLHKKNHSEVEGHSSASLYHKMTREYLDKVNFCDQNILRANLSFTYDSILPIKDHFIIAQVRKRRLNSSDQAYGVVCEMSTDVQLFKNSPLFSAATPLILDANTALTKSEVKILYLTLAYPKIKARTIATVLNMSPSTVYVYKSSLMNKTLLFSRQQLINMIQEQFGYQAHLVKNI